MKSSQFVYFNVFGLENEYKKNGEFSVLDKNERYYLFIFFLFFHFETDNIHYNVCDIIATKREHGKKTIII